MSIPDPINRNDFPSHALTFHAPWAWAVVHGVKTVENRKWPTNHRGPIFVHAGRSFESDLLAREQLAKWNAKPPPEFARGVILGTVDIVDVLPLDEYLRKFVGQQHLHEMAIGPWCWVLANPRECEPVRHAGNFQLWPVQLPTERFRFLDEIKTPQSVIPQMVTSSLGVSSELPPIDVRFMYDRMLSHYGPQKWWPAETPLEIIIGLILVRNCQWSVAAKVIERIHSEGLMQIKKLHQISDDDLLELIRPVGRQRAKASLIKRFINEISEKWNGFLMPFLSRETKIVREELLAMHGIGPETADMILLYAGNHPVCPVDDYTKRVLMRHRLADEKSTSERIADNILGIFGPNPSILNELHALFVQVGRDCCLKTNPKCDHCPLNLKQS